MGDALEGDFRKAMRTLASAVTIVSTAHNDRRFGMTATAVCSLSIQPPTLLVCVNQSTSLHHPLLSAGRFCINILHADQTSWCERSAAKALKIGSHTETGSWTTAASLHCRRTGECVLYPGGQLRPSNTFHRGRRRLSGEGARQRSSAALSRWTIYRRPRRRRRLGHPDRSLKFEAAGRRAGRGNGRDWSQCVAGMLWPTPRATACSA